MCPKNYIAIICRCYRTTKTNTNSITDNEEHIFLEKNSPMGLRWFEMWLKYTWPSLLCKVTNQKSISTCPVHTCVHICHGMFGVGRFSFARYNTHHCEMFLSTCTSNTLLSWMRNPDPVVYWKSCFNHSPWCHVCTIKVSEINKLHTNQRSEKYRSGLLCSNWATLLMMGHSTFESFSVHIFSSAQTMFAGYLLTLYNKVISDAIPISWNQATLFIRNALTLQENFYMVVDTEVLLPLSAFTELTDAPLVSDFLLNSFWSPEQHNNSFKSDLNLFPLMQYKKKLRPLLVLYNLALMW